MKKVITGIAIAGTALLGGWWFLSPSNENNLVTREDSSNYLRTDDPETTRDSSTGDYDCSDFSSQSEAQDFFEDEGGPENDYHNLDRDADGIACESL